MRAETNRPYDLAAGPLVRVLLVRLADNEHVRVLGMHHIVTDGWSMGVVTRELGELCAARTEGREPDLPEVAVQYPDFAAWQRGRLEDGGLLDRQLDWWRERLEGVAPLELPADRPRPSLRSSAGAAYTFPVPAGTTTALRDLAQRHGATLFMALTAAVKTVFARWSGQEDIAVGTASSGRDHRDLENLVGFLVNTVVLRSHVDPDMSYAELLARLKETVLEAFAHQDVPFERLVEAVGTARDTSRTPLVQAMVVLQNAPGEPARLPGVRTAEHPVPREAAPFDLTVEFFETDGGLTARVGYSTALFDEATIARFAGHLTTVLRAARRARPAPRHPADADGRRVRAGRHRRERLPVRPVPGGTFPELVAEAARQRPDAPAVEDAHTVLTYRELDERANRLAHHLVCLGAGPGTFVGLCVERGVETVVGLLGIMKAGAAYLPLDPGYPADRLAFMLRDSGARLVVTRTELAGRLPDYRRAGRGPRARRRRARRAARHRARAGPAPRRPRLRHLHLRLHRHPEGRPRPTPRHRQPRRRRSRAAGRRRGQPGPAVRLLVLRRRRHGGPDGPPAGATLVLPPHGPLVGEALQTFLRERRITHALLAPSAVATLVPEGLDGLRTLVVGGEASTGDLVARWSAGRRMVNAYGPTESTVVATMSAPLTGGTVPPIGTPLP